MLTSLDALLVAVALGCPVSLPNLAVLDPYREPACTWCAGNRGIEYRTQPGRAVAAAADGEVTFAGRVAGVVYVVVRAADDSLVTHGGLAALAVSRGDRVRLGEPVGEAGETLHLGLRRDGRYVDPASCATRGAPRRTARAVIIARGHR